MKKISDEELVARCQQELPYQTRSFETLVNRYKLKVFRKVYSIIKNEEEARDLTQDILIKIFHALPSFRRESSFSTWLYAVTVNTCLNHKEKMQRRPWWWLAEDVADVTDNEQLDAELFYLIGQSHDQGELRQMIEVSMDSLNDKSKEVLLLRYFEELDYKTMASRLGINLSAAKMRLKRAREQFQRQFEKRNKGKE